MHTLKNTSFMPNTCQNFAKHQILSQVSNVAFLSPVSAVYVWNAWDHDPAFGEKAIAFSDLVFPTEAQVKSILKVARCCEINILLFYEVRQNYCFQNLRWDKRLCFIVEQYHLKFNIRCICLWPFKWWMGLHCSVHGWM